MIRFPLLAAILTLALLSGCAKLPSLQAPVKHYYVIEAAYPDRPVMTGGQGVVKVRSFKVSPRYDDKEMVIRTGARAYESDYYNLYFASLGPMLAEESSRYLARTGVFADVVDPSSRAESAYSLEGNILAAHGDYSDSAHPKAVMTLQFLLLANGAEGHTIAFHRDYTQEVPLSQAGPQDLATGLSTALTRILADLTRDLASAPR